MGTTTPIPVPTTSPVIEIDRTRCYIILLASISYHSRAKPVYLGFYLGSAELYTTHLTPRYLSSRENRDVSTQPIPLQQSLQPGQDSHDRPAARHRQLPASERQRIAEAREQRP